MSLSNKVVLVTGANRGIGAALVRELLKAGVSKVYASARNTASLPDFGDKRVVPLQLDVTSDDSVNKAAAAAKDVDVLVNNAGTAAFNEWTTVTRDAINGDMDTNFYGTLRVIQAFTPQLTKRGSGTIANVVSVVGLAPVPALAGYSASKAALQSLTQALRTTLKPSGVKVIGIYPGPIDTDLAKNIPMEKATAEHCAENIVRGLENDETYIFPDPVALQIGHLWANNGREVEVALQGNG